MVFELILALPQYNRFLQRLHFRSFTSWSFLSQTEHAREGSGMVAVVLPLKQPGH